MGDRHCGAKKPQILVGKLFCREHADDDVAGALGSRKCGCRSNSREDWCGGSGVSLPDLDGKTVKLSDFKGKKVVLELKQDEGMRMRRQIQVTVVVLLAAACRREAGPAAAPYLVSTARAGEVVHVEVKTAGGYHVNEDYPVSFVVADGGTRLQLKEETKLTAPCAEGHCALEVNVPGSGGTLAFSVCSKNECLIEKVAITSP